MKGRVLVTGGTGAVGPAVVSALLAGGWEVRALVRTRCDIPGAEVVVGDLRDPDSLRNAVQGVDAIVHMAALLHLFHTGAEQENDFYELNVEPARVMLAAAPLARFVLFSSITVYGCGGPFSEESPSRPLNAYARTKVEAERIVLAAGGTVLRLAAVYGSRMKGNYASLVRSVRRGRFIPVGRGENRRTLVLDHDVGQAVVLVLRNDVARGAIYNVTDGTTHRVREIIAATAEAFGKRPPRLRIPVFAVRAGGRLIPRVGRLLDKYLEEVCVDGTKLQRELGFQPQSDFRSVWIEAVRGLS